MTELFKRIFGNVFQQAVLKYVDEMKAKGMEVVQKMDLSGKFQNPPRVVFGFSKSEVKLDLNVQFAVEKAGDKESVYATDATLKPNTPWQNKYFFFCQRNSDAFTLPNFPSIQSLKEGWCKFMKKEEPKNPAGQDWCATDAQTLDDYYLYGDPYGDREGCVAVRSLEIYSFRFKPDDDGLNVRGHIKYDLRFKLPAWGYVSPKMGDNSHYSLSQYFKGGFMLGGATKLFQDLLTKTKVSKDCMPAIEALLHTMLTPTLATP